MPLLLDGKTGRLSGNLVGETPKMKI